MIGSPEAAEAAEAAAWAGSVARHLHDTLGTVSGVVLHGSLVLDAYQPGASDIDLLAVLTDPLTEADVAATVDLLDRLRATAPAPVDLRMVTAAVAGSPTRVPLMEAYLRATPGPKPVEVEGRHAPERDLVVELSVCRQVGRALLGPQPRAAIGDVPDDWVIEVGRAQVMDWLAIGDDPEFAQLTVLTTCRVWRFAEQRLHCSKQSAAAWALDQDGSLSVVRDALRQRDDPTVRIDPTAVDRFLTRVARRLDDALTADRQGTSR